MSVSVCGHEWSVCVRACVLESVCVSECVCVCEYVLQCRKGRDLVYYINL